MSTFLSYVGRMSARFRWVVIAAWLVVFAALIALLVAGSGGGSSETAEQAMPDTPASLALDRMAEEFPSADMDSKTLQLVFHPDSGNVMADPTTAEVAAVIEQAGTLPGVETVSDPFDPAFPYVSEDGTLAVSTLTYGDLTEDEQKDYYEAALDFQENAPPGLGVELGGNLVPLGAPESGPGEGVGVIIAFVVLALTFGSLLAAGVNLLIAIFGVGVGLAGILAYGSFVPMGDNSIILAAMLGLAVGIDYSLFILSRFRNELRGGRGVEDAVARATGTAGTAVAFAGSTVIVALVALIVANLSFITEMGIAAAFAVLVSVLLALTLLPALMRFLGYRALSRRQRAALASGELWVEGQQHSRGVMHAWGRAVVSRPFLSLVAGVVILVVAALPMLSMKTAFSVPGGSDPSTTERAAYNLVLDSFGGVQSPLIVLAEGDGIVDRTDAIVADLSAREGVQRVAPPEISANGDIARIVVIAESGPIDDSTKSLVHEIRADADAIDGVRLEVTGETAMGIDQDEQLMAALVRYVVVIVLISIALMILLFRSLVIPVIATVGYLLSVAAAFGASVAVFQWGWFDPLIAAPQGDPMLSLLPLLLVGVLFGLAMDYQVFLVSRIQEMHRKGLDPREAIREGVGRSGPVLVAAATIMIAVFAGFAAAKFAIGASIALGLMVGVAADAFIVRLILIPAAMTLLGRSAWWLPAWLDRILPDVDVEGRSLDAASPATPPDRPEPALVG